MAKLVESLLESLAFHWPFDWIYFQYFLVFCRRSPKTFSFNNETYEYFYHKYNHTWRNERAVEIPIVKRILEQNAGKKILEVGNVLSHYFETNHDILDKYEQGKNIINQDIVDFKSPEKYDLIVSISTIEHVGFDENPKKPFKFIKTIDNLKRHLNPGGRIIMTFSLGYNSELDKSFRENCLDLTKSFCLKRISKSNKWQETTLQEAITFKYNYPYHAGNAVVIGIIQ